MLQFFRKCEKARSFAQIVFHFVAFVLPTIDSRDSKDILLSFLGHKLIVNWILLDESSFYQAMGTLDEVDKKLVYFKIKMEIENYYMENYLRSAWLTSKVNASAYIGSRPDQIQSVSSNLEEFSKTVGLPSKQWQKVRLDHANDSSKIVVPGSCIICKLDKAVIVDVDNYLKSIPQAYGPDPVPIVSGRCSECGGYASGSIMQLEWFTCAWS